MSNLMIRYTHMKNTNRRLINEQRANREKWRKTVVLHPDISDAIKNGSGIFTSRSLCYVVQRLVAPAYKLFPLRQST